MLDKPIDLDERRDLVDKIQTDIRRRQIYLLQQEQSKARHQKDQFEELLLSTPSKTWAEASVGAVYLIELLAQTREAQEPRCQDIISHVLKDLKRLRDYSTVPP